MPKISVIVPLYNKSKYVASMIESVLSQSFNDYELIIIDDGSTDGSAQIVEGYAQNDSRIRLISIENAGVSHARNVGLNLAEGEYILFIDADDTIGKTYFEPFLEAAENTNVPIVIGGLTKRWESRSLEIHPPYRGPQKEAIVLKKMAHWQNQTGIYGFCVSKLISRTLIGETRFDESIGLAEDFDFYIKLYSKINSFCFVDSVNYTYLQETENSSMLKDDSGIDYYSQLLIQLRFAEYLSSKAAYSDENKAIVEQKIRNYMFYSLYYADKEEFLTLFDKISSISQDRGMHFPVGNNRQKALLYLLGKKQRFLSYCFIMTIHFLRKWIRRV